MTHSPRVTRHVVCDAESLLPGHRRIVDVAGRSIGVFNVDGTYLAIRNVCPHQGGPLCLGTISGKATARLRGDRDPDVVMERHGEILKCPWHGWQFDLRTGHAVFGDRVHVATYRAYVHGASGREMQAQDPEPDVGPVETYRTSLERGVVVVEVPDR